MAAVQPTITQVESIYGHVHVITWAGLANGDTGVPIQMPGAPDRSAHVFGTFGVGGSVAIEGSNEVSQPAAAASTWTSLHDATNTALAITAQKLTEVLDISNWIRPHVTAGDGTTSLTVALVVRRPL